MNFPSHSTGNQQGNYTLPLVVISLGSNQHSLWGDARTTILTAMGRLATQCDNGFRASSLWKTAPIDCPPGTPHFVNAAVALPLPAEDPEEFLAALQALEAEVGRKRPAIPNSPRPLDLDLICWGELVLRTPKLVLPHPRATERGFVMLPLAEIAPDLIIPGQTRSAGVLAAEMSGEDVTKIT